MTLTSFLKLDVKEDSCKKNSQKGSNRGWSKKVIKTSRLKSQKAKTVKISRRLQSLQNGPRLSVPGPAF